MPVTYFQHNQKNSRILFIVLPSYQNETREAPVATYIEHMIYFKTRKLGVVD